MAKASRTKGLLGEREVAELYREHGWEIRGLEGSGDFLAFKDGVTHHVEVKRAERAKHPEWRRQAVAEAPNGTVPVVWDRQNHGRWWAAMPGAALLDAPKATR